MEKKYVREGDAHGGFGETERVVVELREGGQPEQTLARSWMCVILTAADASTSAVVVGMPANMLCGSLRKKSKWC